MEAIKKPFEDFIIWKFSDSEAAIVNYRFAVTQTDLHNTNDINEFRSSLNGLCYEGCFNTEREAEYHIKLVEANSKIDDLKEMISDVSSKANSIKTIN